MMLQLSENLCIEPHSVVGIETIQGPGSAEYKKAYFEKEDFSSFCHNVVLFSKGSKKHLLKSFNYASEDKNGEKELIWDPGMFEKNYDQKLKEAQEYLKEMYNKIEKAKNNVTN